MLRKNILIICVFIFSIFIILGSVGTVKASTNDDINIYFFFSDSCPHCKEEGIFLSELQKQNPNLQIYALEVSKNSENRKLFKEVALALNQSANGVPFVVIGDKHFIGFLEGVTDVAILKQIDYCRQNGCEDLIQNNSTPVSDFDNQTKDDESKLFSIPVLGQISAQTVSLPLLTIVLGFVDGFNPCAMWVLLFLISMLIGLENKKRRWTLGIVFIIASAFVYFLFMSLWLNLLLFIGFIIWVRIGIGLIAVGGGLYNLKNGLQASSGCSVTGSEKKKKIFNQIKGVINRKSFILAILGMILLAFSVNLIELICSAGLPAIYTQVLAINNLATWQYYIYIFAYILIFMLDDLVVFFVAMKTLEVTGVTTKYSKVTRIIGGLIMFVIGILLLFKPSWIMFG